MAEGLSIQGNSLRVAFERSSVDEIYLNHCENILQIRQNIQVENDYLLGREPELEYKNEIPNISTKNITGFYYPNVYGSAGFKSMIDNLETERIAVSIPNWGKDNIFINVYGDSMYPKYCSGEIIGIKEIEYQYLNYGYAYVVVMKNGDVHIKYVKAGKDENNVLLVSENKEYDSREFHIKKIDSFYIIKGVISKVTM